MNKRELLSLKFTRETTLNLSLEQRKKNLEDKFFVSIILTPGPNYEDLQQKLK